MGLLSGLIKGIAPVAQVAGNVVEGFNTDRQNAVKAQLASDAAKRQSDLDALTRQIKERDLSRPQRFGDLLPKARGGDTVAQGQLIAEEPTLANEFMPPLKTPAPVEYTPAKFTLGGKATQGFVSKEGKYFDANRNPVTGEVGIYEEPKTPPQEPLEPVQQEDGSVIYVPRSQAAGKKVPSPSNQGAASLTKARAALATQVQIIDDALAELDAHPDAVGLTRGLPLLGDRLDQRMDPAGVAARAQIANIGSLKLHDRSGAAISVHEFPRLAPFIPAVSDTPETIRTKLRKLRDAIQVEQEALLGGSSPTPGHAPGNPALDVAQPISDADFSRAYAAGARTDEDVRKYLAAHPKKP